MKQQKPIWLLAALCPLMVAACTSVTLLERYDKRHFIIAAISLCVSSILFLVSFFLYRKNVLRFIAKLNDDISTTERESMYTLPSPTVIIDEGGQIIWYNKFFTDRILDGKDVFGVGLTSILKLDMDTLLAQKTVR